MSKASSCALLVLAACGGGDPQTTSDAAPPACPNATVHEGDLILTGPMDLSNISAITGDLVADKVDLPDITADCLTRIDGRLLVNLTTAASLSFGSLTSIGGGFRPSYNDGLVSISMPVLATIGGSLDLHVDRAVTSLAFPALTEVGGDVVLLDMGALETIDLSALTAVHFANVTSMPTGQGVDLYNNPNIIVFELPALTTMGGNFFISDNPRLQSFSLPLLATTPGGVNLQGNAALTTVSLPELTDAVSLVLRNVPLTTLDAPKLASSDYVSLMYVDTLTNLSLPALTSVATEFEIDYNAGLAGFELGAFTTFGGLRLLVHDNPALPRCLVDALYAQLQAAGYTGPATITGNDDAATCP